MNRAQRILSLLEQYHVFMNQEGGDVESGPSGEIEQVHVEEFSSKEAALSFIKSQSHPGHYFIEGPEGEIRPKYVVGKGYVWEDFLPGGRADNADPSEFDPEEIQKGIQVEMEHTRNTELAQEIAMDHLKENPHYYSDMERAKKELDIEL